MQQTLNETERVEQTKTRIPLGRQGWTQSVRNHGFTPKQPHQVTPRNSKPNRGYPKRIPSTAINAAQENDWRPSRF